MCCADNFHLYSVENTHDTTNFTFTDFETLRKLWLDWNMAVPIGYWYCVYKIHNIYDFSA